MKALHVNARVFRDRVVLLVSEDNANYVPIEKLIERLGLDPPDSVAFDEFIQELAYAGYDKIEIRVEKHASGSK